LWKSTRSSEGYSSSKKRNYSFFSEGFKYREYFKRLGASQGEKIERLASEFRGDWNNGFSDVCQYLQQFAKGEEQEPITSIIQGITNPE